MPSDAPEKDVTEADLRRAMELLFFAYRDFTAGPDAILADYGFGRAHHRALYFVGRSPGITVSELLATLRITKQSLGRVLAQLVDEDIVEQITDPADKRRRRLYLTDKGKTLESKLSATQFARLQAAFADAPKGAAKGFATVLKAMIDEDDRGRF